MNGSLDLILLELGVAVIHAALGLSIFVYE